jgi:hypothetical protein
MMGMLARFAATGDPRGGAVNEWPPYTLADDESVAIDTGVAGINFTVTAGVRRTACDFGPRTSPSTQHPRRRACSHDDGRLNDGAGWRQPLR